MSDDYTDDVDYLSVDLDINHPPQGDHNFRVLDFGVKPNTNQKTGVTQQQGFALLKFEDDEEYENKFVNWNLGNKEAGVNGDAGKRGLTAFYKAVTGQDPKNGLDKKLVKDGLVIGKITYSFDEDGEIQYVNVNPWKWEAYKAPETADAGFEWSDDVPTE